ncbi:hypothetical protein Plhal703r1_c05g0030591 [Plasmopara halstedii]
MLWSQPPNTFPNDHRTSYTATILENGQNRGRKHCKYDGKRYGALDDVFKQLNNFDKGEICSGRAFDTMQHYGNERQHFDVTKILSSGDYLK